jgi:uncharacterized membrane protein (UPF0182 family)
MRRSEPGRGGCILLVILAIVLIVGARAIAGYFIDYQWWKEMGQVSTWLSMLAYGVTPAFVGAIIAFAVFWIAHARAMRAAGTRLTEYPFYFRISTLALIALALIFAFAAIDSWTVVRYAGARSLPANATTLVLAPAVAVGDRPTTPSPTISWKDPVFGHPLSFYLFEVPFYSVLLRYVLGLTFIASLLYWITARGWQLRMRLPHFGQGAAIDLSDLRSLGGLESRFLRGIVAVFLLALAVRFFLDRYEMLLNDHGFMVGVDWVNENIGLPLQWLAILAAVAAAALFWSGRWKLAIAMAGVLILQAIVPRVISAIYVRPNEIAIQKPYIQRHIEATRAAYGLDRRSRETEFAARADVPVSIDKNRAIFDNVRLWDWRAFHDTVSQIQPLRPYTFTEPDVDRYTLDGQLRQVLLSSRELDLAQLGDARNRWINPHFVYTHGYGVVMAEANQITPTGLPVLFIRDAPPVITTPSLKLTRPQLYYGEVTHEPVFVRTEQQEFDYPSGGDNVHTRYDGAGGFPISSFFHRLAAAVSYGDWNILLTGQLTSESRMMIHRRISERLEQLAGFVRWDSDPYLVVTEDGRLVWIVDGYLTSDAHPYSREVSMESIGTFNYIRNSVKATVDAYTGAARLYVFDPSDPLIRAYQNLFPNLFQPEAAMPADLRTHTRYPEMLFRAQAEIYRTFHMRDAEAFYNKADLWDIARWISSQETQPQPVNPTYVVATLPGEAQAEFLLMIPFTPRNKDNLIGMMVARCDGPQLGELNFLLLSKQELLLGPMQVEARINQDQNISKDLTLWNQQGSQVLRGQMIVLPVDNTFVYVEPIYIQAKEARMPQMKKVVVAVGNTLIYTDTYEQALAQLSGTRPPERPAAPAAVQAAQPLPAQAQPAPTSADQRLNEVASHLRRYRDLAAQGRWSEAGKELEAIQAIVEKK